MDTYDEWRLIFHVDRRKDVDRLAREAASRVPEDVDVHTRGDQIVVYGFTEEATKAAGQVVSELLTGIGVAPNAPTAEVAVRPLSRRRSRRRRWHSCRAGAAG